MHVVVNNEKKEVALESTLHDLLAGLSLLEGKGIAVAVNNSVVSRDKWLLQKLSNEDKITIIKATQGG